MFRRPKSFLFTVFLVLALAFAQSEERIIRIDFSGGSQSAPDLRYGPFVYTHPDPEGIVATVSNLTIYAQNAELAAPEGVLIAEAEGQRTASFTDGVRVARGRLEANGPGLVYSETTGLGVMEGPAAIVVAPTEEGDNPVNIGADEVTFDVDTDVSTSRGNVTLQNGNQSATADELVFEEDRNLAKLTSEGAQVTVTRQKDDGDTLTITADDTRALTEEDRLLSRGSVTTVDGDITSTGDVVCFDDATSQAEIIGNPAVSVNAAQGITLSGARLLQRTDIDVVEVIDASQPSNCDEAAFSLTSEAQ